MIAIHTAAPGSLLTLGNPKTAKGEARGYLTGVMHLAPHTLSGYNVCAHASTGCAAACLNTAGRGGIFKPGETTNRIQEARIQRTRFFFQDRDHFERLLAREVESLVRKAQREGLTPAVRLNGTSDLPWERLSFLGEPSIMAAFPDLQFYDYTKVPKRRTLPSNYHLTFSLNEANLDVARQELAHGRNVAVVFRHKPFPDTHWDAPVVDGDESDLRFLDPNPCVVGLKAKGRAKHDYSGFVQEAA